MALTRTSITHPLQIATLDPGEGLGRIGVTFCPGKVQSNALTGAWERDLHIDLDAVKEWGAAAVITLLEPSEMTDLKVEALGHSVLERGMRWFHLPIRDVGVPGPDFEAQWRTAGEAIRELIRHGSNIVIHCKGGLGRAGMVAARILVELGWKPGRAIKEVRRVRPGAIETETQCQHVLASTKVS